MKTKQIKSIHGEIRNIEKGVSLAKIAAKEIENYFLNKCPTTEKSIAVNSRMIDCAMALKYFVDLKADHLDNLRYWILTNKRNVKENHRLIKIINKQIKGRCNRK